MSKLACLLGEAPSQGGETLKRRSDTRRLMGVGAGAHVEVPHRQGTGKAVDCPRACNGPSTLWGLLL